MTEELEPAKFSQKNENHPTLKITMFRLKTLFLNNHNDFKVIKLWKGYICMV
jgi:hypothetical protein